MSIINCRFVVVFKEDGLDLEGMKPELNEYGEIFDIDHDTLIDEEGNKTPVCLVYLETSYAKYFGFKLKYYCVSAEDNQYVLFPMESMEEMLKVLKTRK